MATDQELHVQWSAPVHTLEPIESMPRITMVAQERRFSPSYHWAGRWRQNSPHLLFQYSLRGTGRFWQGDQHYNVPAGHGFLCRIADPSTGYYYPREQTGTWEFLYINMLGSGLDAQIQELNRRWGPIHAVPMDHGIMANFATFSQFDGRTCNLSAGESAELTHSLLVSIVREHELTHSDAQSLYIVRRAQDIIRQQLAMNVSDLARELNISREHLTRLFRKHLDESPYQYILHRRVHAACHHLKTSSLSVKEIAAKIGFETCSQFNHNFKRMYGMTPGAFRRRSGVEH